MELLVAATSIEKEEHVARLSLTVVAWGKLLPLVAQAACGGLAGVAGRD